MRNDSEGICLSIERQSPSKTTARSAGSNREPISSRSNIVALMLLMNSVDANNFSERIGNCFPQPLKEDERRVAGVVSDAGGAGGESVEGCACGARGGGDGGVLVQWERGFTGAVAGVESGGGGADRARRRGDCAGCAEGLWGWEKFGDGGLYTAGGVALINEPSDPAGPKFRDKMATGGGLGVVLGL